MSHTLRWNGRVFPAFALAVLLLVDPVVARPKVVKKGSSRAPEAPAVSAPRVQVALESIIDRRTSADFPRSSVTLTLALRGDDAQAVKAARPRVSRAVDDAGQSVAEPKEAVVRAADGWQEARVEGSVAPRIELASSARKAKALTAVEGVVEVYLPSRDPAATVKIDRVLSKKDKPLAIPVLERQGIRLRVLSKAGLEREKKEAEAKKKAQAAKKKAGAKKDGLEGTADAMADVLITTIQSLFSNVGENDLILKVDDPGKKIFSFDVAGPDGTAIQSYGTTDLEGFRIVRMLEPIPPTASLQVRLKTAKSFAEIPFALADVKLP